MTKKQIKSKADKRPIQNSTKKPNKAEEKIFGDFLNFEIIIILLYLLTEFVPQFDAIDVMGSQWLYLSILNCFTTLYLLIRKRLIPNQFFKSTLFILYFGFVLIAGLSFFVSYNIIESIVTYTRLLVSFIAFINIISLINYNSKILKNLFFLMGLIVMCQSLDVIIEFITKIPKFPKLDDLILSLTGNTGNKNILAASIVIKIPFVLYAIYNVKRYGRIFYLTILFLCFFSIFIINARASFISLFLEILIFIILIIIYYFKNRRELAILLKPALVIGVLILSVFIFQISFSALQKQKIKGEYGGLEQRISEISISNPTKARFDHWKYAIDFTKKHPSLGGGYGNWKINTIPYEKDDNPAFVSSKHAHNDFLEIFADTGILGGLIYLGVFICLFLYAFKVIFSNKNTLDYKLIVSTVLMCLTAYFIDAFFNFPIERPNIQILLAFIIAILSYCYFSFNKNKESVKSIYNTIVYFLLFLSIFTIYFNYKVFKSLEMQNMTFNDLRDLENYNIKYKSAIVNDKFPWIPNISEQSISIACIKAKYLLNEQKYNEAIEMLNSDTKSNPYFYFSEYLRGRIAEKLNQLDSAFNYAKMIFHNRPRTELYYKFLNNLAIYRKDSVEIENSFKEFSKVSQNPELWSSYAKQMYNCTNNLGGTIKIIQKGLNKYPKDSALLYNYNFYVGISFYRQKEYVKSINYFNESLKFRNNDSFSLQDLGFAYYNMKLYKYAIPYFTNLINRNAFKDGKNEFLRGMCYSQLGQKDSACFDFKNAKDYGYNVDPGLIDGCK